MADYYSIITNRGKELEAEALANGRPVVLTQFVVGDSNGKQIKPDPEQIRLINETFRGDIAALVVSPEQASQLMAKIVLPTDVGGFTVREVGLLTDSGELYAVANCPSIDKPAGGVSVNMQFRLAVSDTSNITLNVATGDGLFLRIDQNLKEIKARGDDAQRESRESIGVRDASTQQKGLVQLNSAVNSTSETQGATPAAVRIAMENANARLAKERNGADIPNKPLFIQNVGLQETVNQAGGAVQRSGDEMTGKLSLPQTSSFGVNTENVMGGNSIAIGDNDTGFKQNSDGVIDAIANNVQVMRFTSNAVQVNNSSGSWINLRDQICYAGQNMVLNDSASAIVRQEHQDRHYILGGLGNHQFGIYMINKNRSENGTDCQAFLSDDGHWYCGQSIKTGNGASIFSVSGDIYGPVWGHVWLSEWLSNAFASRDNAINARATPDWVIQNFVQNVQRGAQGSMTMDGALVEAPAGCFLTGGNGNEGNQVGVALYRPLQIWRGYGWATISG